MSKVNRTGLILAGLVLAVAAVIFVVGMRVGRNLELSPRVADKPAASRTASDSQTAIREGAATDGRSARERVKVSALDDLIRTSGDDDAVRRLASGEADIDILSLRDDLNRQMSGLSTGLRALEQPSLAPGDARPPAQPAQTRPAVRGTAKPPVVTDATPQ